MKIRVFLAIFPLVALTLVGCSALGGGNNASCPLTTDAVKKITKADNVTSHFENWGQASPGKPKPYNCDYELSGANALFSSALVEWSPGDAAKLSANQDGYPYNGFTLTSTGLNAFAATSTTSGQTTYLVEFLLDGHIVDVEVSGLIGSSNPPPQSTVEAGRMLLPSPSKSPTG